MAKKQEKEMPFLDHLEELRRRLFWMVGAALVGLIVGFVIVTSADILNLLQHPLRGALGGGQTPQLIFLSPADPIRIIMTASLLLGIVLALPVIIYHIWAFLSPGLYENEKKVMIPVLAAALLLFLLGLCMSFFVVLPLALKFLLGLGQSYFTPSLTVSGYFGFVFSLSLGFGAIFEMPIVILGLTSLGILNPRLLGKFRRYAIVILLIICAFLTPPDFFSLVLMFVPVYALYEISVLISHVIYRKREKRIGASDELATPA